MALTVAELKAVFGTDHTAFDRGMRHVRGEVRSTTGFMRTAGATMVGFLGAQVVQGGARLIGSGFRFAKDAAVGFNDQLDRAHTAFTTMLGSGKRARVFLDELKQFATQTPFEFPELLQASQKLLAMGFASEDVLPTLRTVGDAVAGLGGDPEVMNRVIIALGQIKAKGKVQAEEMMQLTESGIGAWKMLADSIGVSVPKAMDMVTKGQVSAAEAIPALTEGMAKQFGGLMSKQTHTFSGAMSNIKDTAVQVIAGVVRPLFVRLRESAVDFAAWLGEGHIQDYLAMIGSALTGETATGILADIKGGAHALWETLQNLWATIEPGVHTLLPMLFGLMKDGANLLVHDLIPALRDTSHWFSEHRSTALALAVAIGALVAITKAHAAVLAVQAAGGLAAYLKATRLVTTATKVWTAATWALGGAMKFALGPIGIVITLLAALVTGFTVAYKKSDTFRRIVDTALRAVAAAGKWMWDRVLQPTFDALVDGFHWLQETARDWKRATLDTWDAVKDGVRLAVLWLVDKMLWFAEKMLDLAVKAFGWAPGIGGKLKDAQAKVKEFREGVNAEMDAIRDEDVKVRVDARVSTGPGGFDLVHGVRVFKAKGGPITGPGGPTDDRVPAMLSAGEWVFPAAAVQAAGGFRGMAAIQRMLLRGEFARKGDLPHYATGGPVFAASTEPFHPYAGIIRSYVDEQASTLAQATSRALRARAERALKELGGRGKLTAGQIARGQAFARSQVGDPYVWGGVGPNGFDCSGFVSAVLNAALGQNPYHRRGSTATMPWAGFRPGMGSFAAGWFTGNPGHMAATVGGLNVESAGGVGVRVGPGARGARDGLFDRIAHFDTGGWLLPGVTLPANKTGRPEAVLSPDESAAFVRIAKQLSAEGVGSQTVHQHFTVADGSPEAHARATALAVRLSL